MQNNITSIIVLFQSTIIPLIDLLDEFNVAQIIEVWLSVPPRILVSFDRSKSPHFHQRPVYLTKKVKFHTIFIFE